MLWDKILPSGIGHTTSCFLSVAWSNDENNQTDGDAYLLCSGCNERWDIKSVTQLNHPLSEESKIG